MNIELGKCYLTRDENYVARIISLIGMWDKKHPVVGEFHEILGMRKIRIDGLFQTYEHWTKDGKYIGKEAVSCFDLVKEYYEDAETSTEV